MNHLVSHFSVPKPRLYGKCGALVVLLFAAACWSPPAVAQAARVSVTINSVNNRACIDQNPFCGKPDMMVRVALRESDGTQRACPDTVPVANFYNIGPLPSCAAKLVTTPVDLIVTIFDVDESKLPGTVSIQSEIRLSASGSGATLPWFRLNGTPQTINGPQASITLTATVTLIPPAFSSPALKVSRSEIDPSLGDQTLASGDIVTAVAPRETYPSGARVRFSVQSPNGAISVFGDFVVPAKGFNLDWDGRINGQVVPPGIYQLRMTLLATGQTISAPVTVKSIPNVFEIQRASPDPWNARAAPLSFEYRLSPRGTITRRVEGPSAAGSACTLAPPIVVPDNTVGPLNAGNGTITVPVTTPANRFLPPGNYCVRFRANGVTGNLIGTREMEINLTDPGPFRIVASLSPAVPWILPTTTAPDATGTQVPVPAAPVFVEVRAFDEAGNPRPTGRIRVRAVPFLIIPVPSDVITTLTCEGVSVCRMRIGMQTLTRATEVIFDADASDLASGSTADPAPQTASAPERGAALVWLPQNRAGPVSVPVSGSVMKGFDTVPRSRTQDVAFHVGTGLDLTSAAQATQVSDGISNILSVFFGGDPRVGANSVTVDRGRSVAFWLTRTPAIVDTEPPYPGTPGAPLCRRTQLESVPFADMQAVIHAVNCRDNADWNSATFSAEFGGALGTTAWHEFHHAAYDLADEYASDGSYYQTSTLPNVMRNATECAREGAEPSLCVQIGTTGWWRAGPTPDVMIGNTRENLDDRRRAKMMQDICSTGGC
jgi:hypothetical protein